MFAVQMARKVSRKLWRAVRPKSRPARASATPDFAHRKAAKLARIRPQLRDDLPRTDRPLCYDFLSDELRREFAVADTANVSANAYDETALGLIAEHRDGLVLDCGAGLRPAYLDNVVNFEVAPYDTTDVRGVGERLPFCDGVFDAAFSLAVLEHVKDPFACAVELTRVLKPGGVLYCVVPFLQPYHGYPHHYYNMTHQGLANLFADRLTVERQDVIGSGRPIWALNWILARWAAGLSPLTRLQFLRMRVADLIGDPVGYLDKPFVTGLSPEMNLELASTTALLARKPG